ncbi:helix-turn-helix domain-containing protein [Sphaerisporangium sp. NPDC005289]|uniref:arsenate reductase/protein-tyrosine-phosphatase family protein n=1 Tax=Sphaerisporangium sp. NPDC005289 TaxID=3155247 RepID=UPI0033B44440
MERDGPLSITARARVHAALGDPIRLSIMDMLALGDASPREIGDALGLPSNLLAHHLKTLQDVGLVERTRSEADRRRTYLRMVPGTLSGLTPVTVRQAPRVVFVCAHNSARSQLAAALWADGSDVPVASAGTRPAARVHPCAVATARDHGLTLEGSRPRRIDEVVRPDDLVVAVCDQAHEGLAGTDHLHWSVPDPVSRETGEAFERAFHELADRVSRLSAAVRPPGEATG